MTEHLAVDGGTLAYDVTGSGPLVVMAHGMGDDRASYRFVVPQLVAAGYRVAAVDLRGCGESSVGWSSYTRTDLAGDLLALVRHLGGPAVLVGHSISGGAVTVAAALSPELVAGIVELGPFTRKQSIGLGDLRSKAFRTGMTRLLMTTVLGSTTWWHRYLDGAFPGRKPADWDDQLRRSATVLAEPGRMKALQQMGRTAPTDAGAQLGNIVCPALVVQGTLDPDWADPRAEGEAVVAAMPAGLGTLEMIDGAGHYPHTQFPDETVALVLPFLQAHARA
ncbi:alpha/beta fold hydrolase [Nocardioides lianchengensis]|uniref:Pimeloyl-ACP methyl ester carboxylesterase n=1 Tax=Nocardioides lianchengensis TaxID=1045774 RepID=A0A1G7A9M8_9ACTN|nr:alpha/beta hydrolase [Nocardioides lianchengensis]NYG13663.1 pimeloyl-ACP methyl ester carboxylesterase [Nocardioides lianchengensis]SDE11532.1 Pimeloyl-ACP methyl ester carboxylesterase [Nocardioides lianchengensis]